VTAALVAAVTVLAVSAHRRCAADLAALRRRVATTAAVADELLKRALAAPILAALEEQLEWT
jgi:hypothetical protein